MKTVLWLCLGFLAALSSHTLFGFLPFQVLAAVYALSLYLLFFKNNPGSKAFFILLGITLAEELLGNARFGLASSLALFIMVLQHLFAQRLRLTSLFAHYLAALCLCLLAYNLILFPLSGFFQRLPSLILVFFGIAIITYFASAFYQENNQGFEF